MIGAGCPLCNAAETVSFHADAQRDYLHCRQCDLVFVPPQFFLKAADEKAQYDNHNNDPDDPRYRAFLSRLANPLIERLRLEARGLDFGCGPGPTLHLMLSEAGFPTEIYDPIYKRHSEVWNKRYDFITASEVVEHLHRPRFELERLWALIRPRGIMGIMTKRHLGMVHFRTWHYKADPTHVIFFSDDTFRWLSERLSAELQIIGPDVVFLRKG